MFRRVVTIGAHLAGLLLTRTGMDRLLRTAAIFAALCCLPTGASAELAAQSREAVLVQGSSLAAAIEAVCAVGGEITHELATINAVGARLTSSQLRELEAQMTGCEFVRTG
jgi:hypothetical protein